MAEDSGQGDRTEAATHQRLAKAREQGNVPVSRELPTLAGFAAVTLVLVAAGPDIARGLALRLSLFLSHAHMHALVGPQGARHATLALLGAAGPFVLAVLLTGAAAVLLQTGFLLNATALRPQFNRISPGAGFRRLFSAESAVEGLKSLGKVAVLSLVTWQVLRGDLSALRLAPRWDIHTLLAATSRAVLHLMLVVLAIQGVIAVGDLAWTRFRHASRLRMTRQEVRDEQKETEGDPKIKLRIRQIRQQRARRRMLTAVPKATVVITNPTHYAVALAYDRSRNAAPRVVAKGVDSLAMRIREVAEAHHVPLVANPPLARALHRVEVDTEIPAEHFQAVAEIIAYVWRLRGQVHGRTGR
jgi:flagellar biosynthetic protein FlhB